MRDSVSFKIARLRKPQRHQGWPWRNGPSCPEWLGEPLHLPVADVAAAALALDYDQPDSKTWEWRMGAYERLRTGVSGMPHTARTHENALAIVVSSYTCLHDNEVVKVWKDSNPYLGTWRAGKDVRCRKCGRTDSIQTGFNNYSGD